MGDGGRRASTAEAAPAPDRARRSRRATTAMPAAISRTSRVPSPTEARPSSSRTATEATSRAGTSAPTSPPPGPGSRRGDQRLVLAPIPRVRRLAREHAGHCHGQRRFHKPGGLAPPGRPGHGAPCSSSSPPRSGPRPRGAGRPARRPSATASPSRRAGTVRWRRRWPRPGPGARWSSPPGAPSSPPATPASAGRPAWG